MNPMQMMAMLQQSNNPMQMLQSMASQNPIMGRALQMGQGKSVQDLQNIAQNLAKQRGMDANQFNQFLSSFGLNR